MIEMTPKGQEVLDEAMALDMVEQQAAAEFAPEGEYSKAAINKLIKSLNKVMPLFGSELVDEVEEDIDGPMLPQILSALMMVNAALEGANITEFSIDIEGLVDDRGLLMAAGALDTAAKNQGFKTFLANPMRPIEVEGQVDIQEDIDIEIATPVGTEVVEEEADVDELLLARA